MPSLTAEELLLWLTPWHGQIAKFLLVLLRISGLLAVGPLLGRGVIPWPARVGLAVTLSMLIVPLISEPAYDVRTVTEFLPTAANECGIGFLLGASVAMIFWAIPLAGQLLDQQHATPSDDDDSFWGGSPQARWLSIWGATCFLMCSPINGHMHVVSALMESFRSWPLGQSANLMRAEFAAELLSHGSRLSLLVVAPALAALLLVNVALGLLGASGASAVAGTIGGSLRPVIAAVVVLFCLSGANQFIADSLQVAEISSANVDRVEAR